MRLLKALALVSLLIVFTPLVIAEQEPMVPAGRTSGRLSALGGAGVAAFGHADVLYWNPAGLVQLESPEVTGGFGRLDIGDQWQFNLAGALPLVKHVVLGLSGNQLHIAEDAGGDVNQYLAALAFPLITNGKLMFGINAKYLQQMVYARSDAFAGGGVDLGLLFSVFDTPAGMELLLGACWIDAQTKIKNQIEELSLPVTSRLGMVLKITPNHCLLAEFDSQNSSNADFESLQVIRAGYEQSLRINPAFTLQGRIGYYKRLDQIGALTMGVGTDFGEWLIDYSLQLSQTGSNSFHQMSLSWKPLGRTAETTESQSGTSGARPVSSKKTPTEPINTRVFSALDDAAQLDKEVAIFKRTPEPTATATPQAKKEETEEPEENITYNIPVPNGPAGDESATLGTRPEMPAYFSGYFSGRNQDNEEFQIRKQELRLHIVVNPFSPNGDGRQDKTIFIGRLVSEKLRISRWLLTISQGSRVVHFFRGGSTLPRNLEWDGKDAKGKVLPDGNYNVTLHCMNENGIETAQASQNLVIKTKAKPATMTGPGTRTLTGANKTKPFVFELPELRGSSDWRFVITNPQGKTVFQKNGNQEVPSKINWIPTMPDNRITEGDYKARIVYQDEIGLKNDVATEFSIQLSKIEITLQAQPEIFKPGTNSGQGVTFSLVLPDDVQIQTWALVIYSGTDAANTFRTFAGKGNLPKNIFWDGKSAEGKNALGGEIFQGVLNVVSGLGQQVNIKSTKLQCDVGEYAGKKALSINLLRVNFGMDSSDLSDEAKTSLRNATQTLEKYQTSYQLQIIGHCDIDETKGNALELSRKRAQIVLEFLTAECRIPEERMQSVGKGSTQLLSKDNDDASHAKNRRVELVLYAQ